MSALKSLAVGLPSILIQKLSSQSSILAWSLHDWHFQASAARFFLSRQSVSFVNTFPSFLNTRVPFFFFHTDKNGEMTGFIIGDKMPLTRDIVSPVRPVVRNATPTGQSRVCQPPAQRQVLSGMPHNTAYTNIPIYLYTKRGRMKGYNGQDPHQLQLLPADRVALKHFFKFPIWGRRENKVMSNKLPFWAIEHVKSIKFLMAPYHSPSASVWPLITLTGQCL